MTSKKIISVIGCGGKTSLIKTIAEENIDKKVLITTTTQILPIEAQSVITKTNITECINHKPQIGIQCLGILNEKGKLGSLPPDVLERISREYDLVLIEADGSKKLPYKGWADYEPVIPYFTEQTIGVVTLKDYLKPATESTVHRLQQFLQLTGLKQGEPIDIDAIVKMATGNKGLFERAVGIKTVFINRAEDECTIKTAKHLAEKLATNKLINFDKILYGSAKNVKWEDFCE